MAEAKVVAVARDGRHRFSKPCVGRIELLTGLGVEGDSHAGALVRHRSRVKADPAQPNLRQVHLIHAELFEDLRAAGFVVEPGQLGENITTSGIELLALPRDTLLRIGPEAEIRITGLRNPCAQIDRFRPGMLKAVVGRAKGGSLVRKAGVMAVVSRGGSIRLGDPIEVVPPPLPHHPLERV